MSDPDFFSSASVVIFGLGLMGGSLAMGLRGRCRWLAAVEKDEETRALAKKLHLIDEISADPLDVVPNADLIVLAIPVKSIVSVIHKLPDWHSGSPLVLDLGSTKAEICRALSSLPARFDPLSGHPMCGKETLGLKNADKKIFSGATFAFTRLPHSTWKSIAMAEQLVQLLGAKLLWIDAETHDRWTAYTSHGLYLAASAFALTIPEEVKPLAGPGLRSTIRLAGTPASMMMDVLATNRQNILQVLNEFRAGLGEIIELLRQEKDQELADLLLNAAQSRNKLVLEIMPGGEP